MGIGKYLYCLVAGRTVDMSHFSEERYVTAYPESQPNPRYHYLSCGKKAGRYFYTDGDMGDRRETPQNSRPLVSVVITSYNYGKYISEALESVINQTYQNKEIIIVDDGSSDNSVELIGQYTKKHGFIHLYTHGKEPHKGLPASIMLGIRKAKGELIAFCESDDLWTPDHLEEKIKIYNEYSGVSIISNAIKMFGNKKDIASRGWVCSHIRKLLKQGGNPVDIRYNQEFNFIPTLSSVMIRRDLLLSLDFQTPVPAWIDFWLYRQILINNKLYFVDKELTKWRQHDSYNGMANSALLAHELPAFLEKSNRLIFGGAKSFEA